MDVKAHSLTHPFPLWGHSSVQASPVLLESHGGLADRQAIEALVGRVGGTASAPNSAWGRGRFPEEAMPAQVGESWLGTEGRVNAARPWGSFVPKPF